MSDMSSIYLDPRTSVPAKDVGQSIYQQMLAEVKVKQAKLVRELEDYRKARFPDKALDDTQTFSPIKDEVVYAVADEDVEPPEMIEVTIMTTRQVKRALRRAKRRRKQEERRSFWDRQKGKIKNYLYEHWGIKFEERPQGG
jgi:hypothetical protein